MVFEQKDAEINWWQNHVDSNTLSPNERYLQKPSYWKNLTIFGHC